VRVAPAEWDYSPLPRSVGMDPRGGKGLRGPSCHGLLNSSSRKGGDLQLQVAKEVFGGHGGAHQSVSCRRGNARHSKHLSLQLLDQEAGGPSDCHRGAVFGQRGRDRDGDSLRGGCAGAGLLQEKAVRVSKLAGGRETGVGRGFWSGIEVPTKMPSVGGGTPDIAST